MLGIGDPLVWLAYVLCLVSTLLCVIYAYVNWNRGDEVAAEEDVKWEAEEEHVEHDL